jgi:hypothetical protein
MDNSEVEFFDNEVTWGELAERINHIMLKLLNAGSHYVCVSPGSKIETAEGEISYDFGVEDRERVFTSHEMFGKLHRLRAKLLGERDRPLYLEDSCAFQYEILQGQEDHRCH